MTRRLAVAVVCVAGLCLGVATLRGEDAKTAGASIAKSADLRTALVGTWKMTSMKINGEKNELPDQAVTYKHVTPAGFTWLSYEKESGKMFRAAGGTYTLKGDDYTETTQYGMGDSFGSMKDASHPFKCRIEGDTWYHVGRLADGTTIDEQWTRVKPADEPKRP
jgi:hypothetical protein